MNSLISFFGTVNADEWRQRAAVLRSNPAFAHLAGAVVGPADLMSWPSAFGEITGKIPDLLQLDPSKLLLNAWATGREFQRYADPEKYPPGETILVALARHTIRSEHAPRLEVMVNDTLVDTVDFELSLKIDVEGAVLTIRDGKIRAVSLGTCTASGELSCEGHTLAKRESEPFELPGRLEFSEPIPILLDDDG